MLSDSVWNHTRDNKSESRCSDIRFCSVTPMSTDRIRLHAVLLPLIITTVLLLLFVCLFSLVVWLVLFLAVKTQRVNQILIMPASTTHGKNSNTSLGRGYWQRAATGFTGPVNITLEEFENGVFTQRNNAKITDHFGLVFEENSGREIAWLSWRHRFRSRQNVFFRRHKTEKPAFSKFLRRLFSKSYVVVTDSVWTIGLTLEIKLRFQIYSATLARMLPEKSAGERISHSSS